MEDEKQLVAIVHRRVLSLPDARQRQVLSLFFGIGCRSHTIEECAESLGVTVEEARRIRTAGLMALQAAEED
jgi:DNA-directed RNA polymerase sigma subunit (sigma70/sigma32)